MRFMTRTLGPALVLVIALTGACGSSKTKAASQPASTTEAPSTVTTARPAPPGNDAAVDADLTAIDGQLGTMGTQLDAAGSGIAADEGDPSK